jgi:hypothetical protein
LPYVLNEELAGDLESGRRKPGWMWVALHGGHLVARAAWWTGHAGASPKILDIFDIVEHPEGVDIGARLLRTAMAEIIPAGSCAPEYSRFVPPDWRDHIASRRVVQEPMAAIEQTSGRFFVERLRLEWHPGTPIPEPTGRLAFRPAEEHTQLVTLMTAILDGTLDAHGRADLATMSPKEAAVRQYGDELMSYESPRDWWRIAELPGGVPVGFVIPAHNGYNPIIAYMGVVPAYRGNGYVHEILAEGTHTRGPGRAADPRINRSRQRPDGRGIPASRMGQLRPDDQHDMELRG